MSYPEALKRLKNFQDASDNAVTKVTKAPFGTSGTPDTGHSQNFTPSGTTFKRLPLGNTNSNTSTRSSPGLKPELRVVLSLCQEACAERYLSALDLAHWIISQGDPDWCRPACVHWWASWIERHGWPGE